MKLFQDATVAGTDHTIVGDFEKIIDSQERNYNPNLKVYSLETTDGVISGYILPRDHYVKQEQLILEHSLKFHLASEVPPANESIRNKFYTLFNTVLYKEIFNRSISNLWPCFELKTQSPILSSTSVPSDDQMLLDARHHFVAQTSLLGKAYVHGALDVYKLGD
jgi:hypothetical protein